MDGDATISTDHSLVNGFMKQELDVKNVYVDKSTSVVVVK
jgi:hypothetical protein